MLAKEGHPAPCVGPALKGDLCSRCHTLKHTAGTCTTEPQDEVLPPKPRGRLRYLFLKHLRWTDTGSSCFTSCGLPAASKGLARRQSRFPFHSSHARPALLCAPYFSWSGPAFCTSDLNFKLQWQLEQSSLSQRRGNHLPPTGGSVFGQRITHYFVKHSFLVIKGPAFFSYMEILIFKCRSFWISCWTLNKRLFNLPTWRALSQMVAQEFHSCVLVASSSPIIVCLLSD